MGYSPLQWIEMRNLEAEYINHTHAEDKTAFL